MYFLIYIIIKGEGENMAAKGLQCLVYRKGKYVTLLPLLDEHDHVLGPNAYLADWDYFTMQFDNKEDLLKKYKDLNLITEGKGEVSISTKPTTRNPHPKAIPVAYQEDYLLAHALQKGTNEISKKDPYTKKFLSSFITDLKKANGRIVTELMHPIQKENKRPNYIDSFLRNKVKDFLYNFADDYSEQREILEEQDRLGKRIVQYLQDDYKRFRGIYFFYKDYSERYPMHQIAFNDIQDSLIRENGIDYTFEPFIPTPKVEEEDAFYDDPDWDPYFVKDPFDHPESTSKESKRTSKKKAAPKVESGFYYYDGSEQLNMNSVPPKGNPHAK